MNPFASMKSTLHRPAATAKNLTLWRTALVQEIAHILEILNMPALIACHSNRLRIFLHGSIYHLSNRAVMPQVNYFCACGLNNTTHDIDCSIMSIKE